MSKSRYHLILCRLQTNNIGLYHSFSFKTVARINSNVKPYLIQTTCIIILNYPIPSFYFKVFLIEDKYNSFSLIQRMRNTLH